MNTKNDRAEQAQKIEKEQQVTEFNNLLAVLAKGRFQYEVYRCDSIKQIDVDNQSWPASIPSMQQYLGEDIRLVIFPWDNTDIMIYEFDPNGAIKARQEVEERLEELK